MIEAKIWYKSKTLWFNLFCFALAQVEVNTGVFQQLMPVNFYAAFVIVVPSINFMLRTISATYLTVKPNAENAKA